MEGTMMLCPVCGSEAVLVGGDVVYPHRQDLYAKRFWRCPRGCAHVGCHPGTEQPLGALATADTRQARQRAHAALDPLWKRPTGRMGRGAAYRWLADQLGIPVDQCHIGSFDEARCVQVVVVCNRKENEHV